MKKGILRVCNKSGIVEFGKGLSNLEYEVYCRGGRKGVLEDGNMNIKSVWELREFGEIMDGGVKRVDGGVHGGILGDGDKEDDLEELGEEDIDLIDMVVVKVYGL